MTAPTGFRTRTLDTTDYSDFPFTIRLYPCRRLLKGDGAGKLVLKYEANGYFRRPCSVTVRSMPLGPLSSKVGQNAQTLYQEVRYGIFCINHEAMCNSQCQAMSPTLRARWRSGGMFRSLPNQSFKTICLPKTSILDFSTSTTNCTRISIANPILSKFIMRRTQLV